jgi:hypothetical protein
MVNKFTDTLFQLVSSLEKAEKRHFKLFIKRSSGNEDLKIIELFDALVQLPEYNETVLLKKLKTIKKPQLSNIKVHLYKQLLSSLRLQKSSDSIDLQLNEQFDFAHILYKKGLFFHSLKILEKAKELAHTYHKINFLLQAITLEKRIESLHITRTSQAHAENLAIEINEVNQHINTLSQLSNLSMLLYHWFLKNGHSRNEKDQENIKAYIKMHLPVQSETSFGFYEKLYLYQSYSWYAYIRQDFINYYRHSQKWIDVFVTHPVMMRVETGHYIKGLHTLLNAHFTLNNYKKMDEVLRIFEAFAATERVAQHDNFRTQAFLYINRAKINLYSIMGHFKEGIVLVPEILQGMETDALFMDEHQKMVVHYKIAFLYFGDGDYATCIDYAQKVIDENSTVRDDLQSYSRLIHLIAHYELGNYEIMDYLAQSCYRFMQKKENLTIVEESLFQFFRKPFIPSGRKQQPDFNGLLEQIRELKKSKYETRTFSYIDILSWLESKVSKVSMREILQKKYQQSRHQIITA